MTIKDKINIVFFGTPDFALTSLEKICADQEFNVMAVVTKPDAPRGRKKIMTQSVVADFADSKNIKVLKPEKMKDDEFINEINSLKADFFVVVAYGKILPKQILELPKFGVINLHGSLLPKYRGAAPIQFSLLNGDNTTGVTTMLLDEGMDTGDMLLKEEIKVEKSDDYFSLSKKLADIGADSLIKTLKTFRTIIPEKQNEELATYTRMIDKNDGKLNYNEDVIKNFNRVRALSFWPVAYTEFKGKKLKVYEADYEKRADCEKEEIKVLKNKIEIGFSDGVLIPKVVQFEGKKKMNISNFVNGLKSLKN